MSATLTGINIYSGGTTVDTNATLSGSTSGIQGNILNNGTVQLIGLPPIPGQITMGPGEIEPDIVVPGIRCHYVAGSVYGGNMSGTGSVHITGGGQIFMTGTNTYTGGTLIDAGNILTGSTSSLQGAITDNGTLQFNQNTLGILQIPIIPNTALIYAGNISGSGSVEVSGGPVAFTGTNTYSGGTSCSMERR